MAKTDDRILATPRGADEAHGFVRSVERAVELMLALRPAPASLGELASVAGLSKATAHRLLTTLRRCAVVVQDPETGTYQLGPACFALADSAQRANVGLVVAARPVLTSLRDLSGESITLNVRVGSRRLCVDERASNQPIRYVAGVGDESHLPLGAGGKVLMAALSVAGQRVVLDGLGTEQPGLRPLDADSLLHELQVVARRGYAISRGERVAGVAALSVPVRTPSATVASLTIIGLAQRLPEVRLRQLREPLLKGAAEIARRFGQERKMAAAR